MAIVNTNLIKQVGSGLDTLPSYLQNNSLDARGTVGNILSPVSQPTSQPTEIGVRNILNKINTNNSVNSATAMNENIQSLAKSVDTQKARIAAGTGTDIAEQYLEDEKEKDEGLLMKVLHFIDAPRNALFNGFKYTFDNYDGGFFEGFWKGLTYEEEYSGYNFAEDLGFDGVGKVAVGFLSEVFFDPMNWVTWGLGAFTKGFIQGAVSNVAQDAATRAAQEGIEELGEQAMKEGVEAGSKSLISSGLRSVRKRAVKSTSQEIAEEATSQAVKGVQNGAGGVLNKLNSVLDAVETQKGVVFGNYKMGAIYRQALVESADTARLYNGIDDVVLTLARDGNYGKSIQDMAENLVKMKQSLIGVDDATRSTLEATIKSTQDDLLEALNPYKLEVRFDAFARKGLDKNALKKGLATYYEDIAAGSLKSLELKHSVDNVADLMNVLDVDEKGLYQLLVKEGFGNRILSNIPDRMLKYGSLEQIRDRVLDNLLDNVAAEKLYETYMKDGMKMLGKGLGWEMPFTNIGREVKNVNEMFELGAKARTLVSYRIGANGVVEKTLAGQALDTIGDMASALFGKLPIIGSAFDDARKLDKADRWALKYIQSVSKNKAKLAATVAENSIEEYYKILKEAGFKSSEEINEVGNFVSTAIESKELTKGASIDEWLDKIKNFEQLDETTINNRVSEQLLELENRYKTNPESIRELFTNDKGEITDEAFNEFYERTKTGLTNDLTNKANLKNLLFKYDDKQQRAVLEVTQKVAEDFDKIGRELVDLNLIPDNRMLEAEYWYFPHKMSLELMLQNQMDVDRVAGTFRTTAEATEQAGTGVTRRMRNVLGGKTEYFTLRNASTWQRKYPMSTVEVNKILEKKYKIPHMLETNAFNTYLLYSLDQGKVIADADEINGVLKGFGIRVNSKKMIPTLRSAGYTIVTRNSNINALQVSEDTMNAIIDYNKKAETINKKIKDIKSAGRAIDKIKANGETITNTLDNLVPSTKELKATTKQQAKDIKAALKEGMSNAMAIEKSTVTDINYMKDLINKGVFPKDIDEDILYSIMDTITNNPYQRGINFSATDTFYNQEMPSIMFNNQLRKEDGAPALFIGKIDDIKKGFRMVPEEVGNIRGADYFYLYSKSPVDIEVPDLVTEMANAANKYTDEIKQQYALQGFDSIRLIDRNTGATAVIPFDENNVFFKNKLRQAEYAGRNGYVKSVANTTTGGYVNPATVKVFVPDDSTFNLSSIPTRDRSKVAALIDDDYKTITNSAKEYSKMITANNNEIDRQLTSLSNLEVKAKLAEDVTAKARLETRISKIQDTVAKLENDNKELNNLINSMTNSRQYNFMAGLKRAKGFDIKADAYLTNKELYNLAGKNKDAMLITLGYDAVIDHVDDAGKTIYRTLPNAKVLSKADLIEAYEANIKAINENELARSVLDIMTDIGTGTDSLSKVIQDYANPEMIASLDRMRNRFKKVMNTDTKVLEAFQKTPLAKTFSKSQERILGSMASSDKFLSVFDDEQKAMDLFDMFDTVTVFNKTEKDIWAIPSEIATYYNKAVKAQTDAGTKLLKDIMYKFNKIWKPSVTAWRPSFGVRNLMSGYFNSFMYAGWRIFDSDITDTALKIVSGKNLDEVVEYGGKKLTLKEIKEQMILTGATNGLVVTDVSSIGEMLADQMKRATDPNYASVVRHPLKTMEKLNAGVEDYNRALLYLAALKNGETFEYAGDLVKQLQFDYSDLTEFEKKIKTIMPFYTWLRKNIPLQVERFMDDPRMFNLLMRRVPDMSKEVSGMTDEEWDNMPDWVKDTFPIVLGKDSSTGRYRLFDTTLPYQDLASLSSAQEMFGEVVSLLHPIVKTPIELFLNKNLYTGAALESYEGETAEQAIKGTANPVLNAIAKVAPSALRSMPGVTVAANQFLNTFGAVRDLKYFNDTKGTGKEGAVYGSKDVGLTGSALLNLIENAIFDTNQMRYYSPIIGMQNALYEQRRDLSNLMQKLEDQGYTIPESVSSIERAAKTTAYSNSKGQAMVNTAIANRATGISLVSNTNGVKISDTVKNALKAGGYEGIETSGVYPPRQYEPYPSRQEVYTSRLASVGNDKLVDFGAGSYIDKNGNEKTLEDIYRGTWGKETMKDDDGTIYRQFISEDGKEYFLRQGDQTLQPWHQLSSFKIDLETYKKYYEEWKASSVDERPDAWYNLYDTINQMDISVYNEMVSTNFDAEKMIKWFLANPKSIAWKQISVSTQKSSNLR